MLDWNFNVMSQCMHHILTDILDIMDNRYNRFTLRRISVVFMFFY